MIYRSALRPLLFTQEAEKAHERTLLMLEAISRTAGRTIGAFKRPELSVEVAGISFPNPIGLAAGCDKNARAVRFWPRLGFGCVEVGTVTAEPQSGNPRPRVFRLPDQEAIVNRLGFNSEGAVSVSHRLNYLRRGPALSVPLAVNIGKTRNVTGESAILDDYRTGLRRLSRFADFVVINVSSPNTPGLREWQEKKHLDIILQALQEESAALARLWGRKLVPLFVKISPDMSEKDIDDVAEVVLERNIAGVIATNTTIARDGALANLELEGGLSGKPLRERSLAALRRLYKATGGRIPLIGVGGISDADTAYERLKAGASLLQLYTALIYDGPLLPLRINEGLLRLMRRDGVKRISEIVGKES